MDEACYRARRGRIGRMLLRWQMYAGFAAQCWRTARRHPDAIHIVTTNPFFAPTLVERATRGRGPTVNLLYDLFPDALVEAGVLRSGGWLANRFAAITRAAIGRSAATVFLGDRLREHAEARYGRARMSAVIPIGADGALFHDSRISQLSPDAPVEILYAGQMGRMHDTATLVAALTSGAIPEGLRFNFHASGGSYSSLRAALAEHAACEFGLPLTTSQWIAKMRQAQVALVTMTQGGQNVVMPSKTYSALVAGQAVLAICPRDSDLADLVRQHECGWIVEPGDVEALRRTLFQMTQQPEELFRRRENAFRAGHDHYDSSLVASRWLELFQQLRS
jgi:colanic acid biosynthesis glycosyl transferase WcaI